MRTDCMEDVPCGLHIIGTERHESRRIDRQLRGRAGRQGDPGASRFFISLEDNLMRLFGSERISGVMDRLGIEEGEVITHPFITKAISKAQKRVEMYNFGIRKRLLEYDDVMNKQREVIYGRRNEIMRSENLDEQIKRLAEDVTGNIVGRFAPDDIPWEEWDVTAASNDLESIFLISFDTSALPDVSVKDADKLGDFFLSRALEAFEIRKSTIPPDIMVQFEKMIMLQSIDEKWMDHLYELDYLREGIFLRSYAQKDPLIEYKQEAFQIFSDMLDDIDRSILWGLFHARLDIERGEEKGKQRKQNVAVHQVLNAYSTPTPKSPEARVAEARGGTGPEDARKRLPFKSERKVGRNDPCPCGSGKKYKKCCGKASV